MRLKLKVTEHFNNLCTLLPLPVHVPPVGRVGLWKDVFTVSMNDKFDTVYRQKMGKSDLTFDFGM